MNNIAIQAISNFIVKYYDTLPNKNYEIFSIYKAADKYVSQNYNQKHGRDLLELYNSVNHLVNKKNIVPDNNELPQLNNYI